MIGSKPVVCVTGSTNNAVFPEATREIQMTMAYCDAIYSAGGVPVVATRFCLRAAGMLSPAFTAKRCLTTP